MNKFKWLPTDMINKMEKTIVKMEKMIVSSDVTLICTQNLISIAM